jgi:hypothetical protein
MWMERISNDLRARHVRTWSGNWMTRSELKRFALAWMTRDGQCTTFAFWASIGGGSPGSLDIRMLIAPKFSSAERWIEPWNDSGLVTIHVGNRSRAYERRCIEWVLMTESNHFTSSKLVRDVVALGRKQSKTGFPNPRRVGCPNRSSLRAMAYRDRRLKLGDIPASHVVSCSPCFQEYTQLRRMAVFVRGLRIAGAALGSAVVIFVMARFVWHHTRRYEAPIIVEKQLAKRQSRGKTSQQAPPIAPLAVTVDLASFSPSRGDGTDDRKKRVHLPQRLLRVDFRLPLGMEPGEYEIRLLDSTGRTFIDKRAPGKINNGITSVEMDIDLASTTRGSLSLLIRPPGLGWRTFPVVVQ